MLRIRITASMYFAFQGVAVLAWWALLLFAPTSRRWFQMGDSEMTLLAFWLPDLTLLAVGSLAAAAACFFESKITVPIVWLVAGAFAYASFYCLAMAIMADSGWLGVLFMFPAMIWSGNFAIGLTPVSRESMFRHSVDSGTAWIFTKTLTQIVVVWSLILVVFPFFIVIPEGKLGIPRFSFPGQYSVSFILFIGLSSIGVTSAWSMAKIGRGTPLPLDAASKLVVAGFYSYVRNPMAVAGIGQGLAVGLFLGSPLVLLYALMGGMIWQFIFRPLEEVDLQKTFGRDYVLYRQNVKCWIPRTTPYQLPGEAT